MSTKTELEEEVKELKKQIRDLKKVDNTEETNNFSEECWGVVTYRAAKSNRYKVVKLEFDYETKNAKVTDEMSKDFNDVLTAIGYIAKNNNTHIMKRAQGRK